MPRFPLRVFALLPLAFAVGCFGHAHNPGYFPNLVPPGDIIQTHAKPGGGAYYRDFDPKAVRLEVSPTQCSNRPGTPQVLVATVYDADGTPRRGRRVEWMIDGPGHIVEVDESGSILSPGRGYKVSDKYAVGYTNLFEHTLTRGTADRGDDVNLAPGQTWCVVSSAVPGETVVTAYAPGVFNWEKGRVSVRVNWGDASSFDFPQPTTARFGGQAALNTTIRTVAAKEGVNPADLRVRYRVVGGLPVEFEPPRGTVGARPTADSLEFPADSDGQAAVRVRQAAEEIRPGKTDIAIEILKPDDDPAKAAKVVGRSRTSVEWVAPALQLEVVAPKAVAVNKESTVTLVATNTGKVEGSPGLVSASFEQGLVVGTATPTPDKAVEQYRRAWSLPALAPGQKYEISVPVLVAEKGTFKVAAAVSTEDGLESRKSATVAAGTSALKLSLDPSVTATVGERVPVKLTVTNPGTVPLDTATAVVEFGSGLEHDTGESQVEATVGVVPPGESRVVTIPLIARKQGRFGVRATVKSGDLADTQETVVAVQRMELVATVSGPERLSPGGEGVFEIGVKNNGDTTVPNVTVRAALPRELTAKQASDGGTVNGPTTAVWRLGDIPPGTSKVLKLSATADKDLERGAVTVTASSGDAANPKDPKLAALTSVKADAPVSVQGLPALLLELADPRESVPVGRRAAYRVVVKNQGSGPAKNVKVTVILPDEYANVRGSTNTSSAIKPEGSKLYFPVVKEIPAGGSATFNVEVEGAKAGDARVRAEVLADSLTKPLSEEQSTKVVERGR